MKNDDPEMQQQEQDLLGEADDHIDFSHLSGERKPDRKKAISKTLPQTKEGNRAN